VRKHLIVQKKAHRQINSTAPSNIAFPQQYTWVGVASSNLHRDKYHRANRSLGYTEITQQLEIGGFDQKVLRNE
jgi:hypothetical protein